MRGPNFFLFAFAGVILVVEPVGAQPNEVAAQASLAAEAKQAADKFQPVAAAEVASARSELTGALNKLDAFFRTGAPYKSVGWKKYLQWDDLAAIAKMDQPRQVELANSLLAKFRANHGGLERPEFTQLRDALANFAAVAAAASDGKLKDDYAQRINELSGQLDAYAKDPASGDAALAIGRILGWLSANRQAPELVSAVRRTYGQPNFFGHASQRFAATGIERDIDQVTPVHDNILGTSIHGTARLVGRTTLALDENLGAASMNILLSGTAWSNSVGYNGPATIFTTGATSVSGRKAMQMSADGLVGFAAQGGANTRSNINDICARCGLIERVAWRKAGQQQGQAEAIASQHAGARVAGQMNHEAGKMIAEQNERYLEKFKNPLVRRGEFPEDLTFSSTSNRLSVRMRQESPGMLAAPGEAPALAQDHDLALQAHESAVMSFGEGVLGGFELTDLRLEKLIKDDLKGEVSDELRVTLPDGTLDPEKDPWSIIFSKELPVRAKFADGGLWLAIRADGFKRGEGDTPGSYKPALTELIEISAAYKIDKTEEGATLRRDGDVVVRFPNRANPEQITLRDSPIVTFIRRKFRSLYKDEFVGEGLTFKGEWAKAGKLKLAEIGSDAAWLRLGWQMPSDPATVAAGGE